ncbi:MAG: hypothetical protein EA409_12985 [Saprospirales bacterium]|nr:MAG: hypothetical protein EA409_12985 [Saprospirales bacterium]
MSIVNAAIPIRYGDRVGSRGQRLIPDQRTVITIGILQSLPVDGNQAVIGNYGEDLEFALDWSLSLTSNMRYNQIPGSIID